MEIFAKNEKIQSLENWKNNISISQWKEGRSAYSLAKYFISHKKDAEDLIQSMLEFVSERENKELSIKDVVAEIEHASKFDDYRRDKMQDLAIYNNKGGYFPFFMGIEAKVDEPFGDTIKVAKKKIKSPRVVDLISKYVPGKNSDGYRYQLLHYLAGSVCENSDLILMPILVFKTHLYSNMRGKKTKKNTINSLAS